MDAAAAAGYPDSVQWDFNDVLVVISNGSVQSERELTGRKQLAATMTQDAATSLIRPERRQRASWEPAAPTGPPQSQVVGAGAAALPTGWVTLQTYTGDPSLRIERPTLATSTCLTWATAYRYLRL